MPKPFPNASLQLRCTNGIIFNLSGKSFYAAGTDERNWVVQKAKYTYAEQPLHSVDQWNENAVPSTLSVRHIW